MMVVLFIKKKRCMRDDLTRESDREEQTEGNGMIIKPPVKKWRR